MTLIVSIMLFITFAGLFSENYKYSSAIAFAALLWFIINLATFGYIQV